MVLALAGDSTTTSFMGCGHPYAYAHRVVSAMQARQARRARRQPPPLAAFRKVWHRAPMRPRHPLLARAFALSEAGRNAEAIVLINQLAAQNEPDALFTLAEMNWRGGMVPQDPVRGRELYRRAGEAGHAGGAIAYTNLLAN